ncbi:hypothetical protein Ancab_038695 [Ancistrocladus abbreviatus]
MLVSDDHKPKFSCSIADGVMGFPIDVANELQIPVIAFHTTSAASIWIALSIPELKEMGKYPFKGTNESSGDSNDTIDYIKGVESVFRVKDIIVDPHLGEGVVHLMIQTEKAQGAIINSFEDLKGPILSQICSKWPKTYAIGPIHKHLTYRLSCHFGIEQGQFSRALAWPSRKWSKVLVGREAGLGDRSKLGRSFAVRFDGRGKRASLHRTVGPQEAVLAHPATGSFMTHFRWSSTHETIVAGVPVIGWPYLADQHINCRYVIEKNKTGLALKDYATDRHTIARVVNEVMERRKDEFTAAASLMATSANKAVSECGSSYEDFNSLVDYIRSMGLQALVGR